MPTPLVSSRTLPTVPFQAVMVSTPTEGTGTPWTAVGVAGRVGAREGGTEGEPVLWVGVDRAGVD